MFPPIFVTQPVSDPVIPCDDPWCFICDIPSSEVRMYMMFPPTADDLAHMIHLTHHLSPLTLMKVNELLDKTHYSPVRPHVPSDDFRHQLAHHLTTWATS